MNGLALCAGIGGLELGLRIAVEGYRTVGYCERDTGAASTLVARMVNQTLDQAPVWDDIETFPSEIYRGKVDIILGGYPCQPWSSCGKRQGTKDDRWIWPAIAEIIRSIKPGLILLENVPGIRNGGLHYVLRDLAAAGYNAEWDVFSCAEVGATHLRKRLFTLAYSPSFLREWALSRRDRGGRPKEAIRGSGSDLPEVVNSSDRSEQIHERPASEGWELRERIPRASGVPMADSQGVRGVRREIQEGDYDQALSGREADNPESVYARSVVDSSNVRERRKEDIRGKRREESAAQDSGGSRGRERPVAVNSGLYPRHYCPNELRDGKVKGVSCKDCPADLQEYWPPGPRETEEWREVLRRDPEIKPAVCRGPNGSAEAVDSSTLAFATDRLRLLGNAVSPLAGAFAFSCLLRRAIKVSLTDDISYDILPPE